MTHGNWTAAGAASPIGYLLAALAIGTAPVLMARAAGQRPPPRPWSAAARRQAGWVLAGLVALSWLFQLHRYGLLPLR